VVKIYEQVLVDLLLSAVLLEETAENAETAHVENLGGHTGLHGTVTLTVTGVTTKTLGSQTSSGAGTRVDLGRLADDKTVLNKLADVLACI
jgi:hypothetical protein